MNLSKQLALGCAVLVFALQFGGCSWLSLGNNETSNSNEKPDVIAPSIEVRKKEIGEKIGLLTDEIKGSKEKQTNAARKILGLNPDKEIEKADLDKAENLCKEKEKQASADCKALVNSKNEIKTKNIELDKAQGELTQISKTSPPTPTPIGEAKSDELGWWNLLLWLVGGIAGLAVLIGLGWLAYSLLANTFKQERETTEHGFKMANKNNQELAQKVNQLEQTVKLQSSQFTQIQTAIQTLQRQMAESGGQNYQQQAIFNQPAYKPEPQFPTAAEDYLNKRSANAQTATADLIGGLLVNDSNKGNEFLIVRDNELPENLFYAVPNQARFQTKSDYLNYYQNYYACENPSGGAVWIKSPTTVRRVNGGWKLEDMGELEIR